MVACDDEKQPLAVEAVARMPIDVPMKGIVCEVHDDTHKGACGAADGRRQSEIVTQVSERRALNGREGEQAASAAKPDKEGRAARCADATGGHPEGSVGEGIAHRLPDKSREEGGAREEGGRLYLLGHADVRHGERFEQKVRTMACEYRTSITQPSCDKVAKIGSSKPKNLTSICIGSPPASTRRSDLARADFSRDDKTHGEGRCCAICVLSPFLSRGDRCAQVACGRPERGERNLRYRRPHRSARTRAHHDHCCGRGAGGTELTSASKTRGCGIQRFRF